MISNEEAAQAIFGGAKAAEAPVQKPAETTDTRLAQALYGPGSKPDAPRSFTDELERGDRQQREGKPSGEQAKPEQPKPEQAKLAAAPEAIVNVLAEKAGLDAAHEDTTSFAKLASEIGISPEHATKLAAWDADRSEKAWDRQFAEWSEATNREFVSADLEAAREIVRQHGDAELQDLLEGHMGLGAHPALVRFVVNIARGRKAR
jgi:hypothetical protein